MKKIFSLMVATVVAVLPFKVFAAVNLSNGINCEEANSDGVKTCTVSGNLTTAYESLTVTLTEGGGADIQTISNVTSSDWSVSSQNEANGVWTVVLSYGSPETSTGEADLFKFTYKVSGEDDCLVTVGVEGATASTPKTPSKDTTTENKQTGSTLPYIALGTIAVLAGFSYLATKNKTKMYKI